MSKICFLHYHTFLNIDSTFFWLAHFVYTNPHSADVCSIAILASTENTLNKALSKINMETGEIFTWTTGNGFCHPAEALFIPRTQELDDNPEDDGLIVATVTDVRENHKDFFVFLEAKTMTEVARVNFKESIPFTSHAYLHRI